MPRMETLAPEKSSAKIEQLSAPVSVTLAAEGERADASRFAILGYTGAVIDRFWGRFVIELTGMRAKDKFPVLREHMRDRIVGWSDGWSADAKGFNVGGIFSSSTDDAREVLALAREGFPWQASIGVCPLRVTAYAAGEKVNINGMDIDGPVDVWEESEVSEVSFVALGADANTEARVDASKMKEDGMNPKLRALLEKLGLSKDASEAEALAFAAKAQAQLAKLAEGGEGEKDDDKDKEAAADGDKDKEEADDDGKDKKDGDSLTRSEALALLADDRRRTTAIKDLVAEFGLPEKLSSELINSGDSLAVAQRKVLAELRKGNPRVNGNTMEEGRSESDKFRELAGQGIMLQLGYKPAEGERPAPGVEDFRHQGLLGLAEMCLERSGRNIRRMSKSQIAQAILSPSAMLAASTSDYPAIFMDVVNKVLQRSYAEAPSTWRPIVNVTSARDFRDIYGIQLSAGPDLLKVRENEEYTHAYFKDHKERYRVDKYGIIITLSYEMLVNDDLSAFAALPRRFAAMTSRKQSDVIYSLIINSPKMSDGNPLFHSAHRNLGTAAPLDTKSLDLAWQAMKAQKGLQNETLDISPRYLLVPPSLRTNALVLLTSSTMPVAQMPTGTYNVWQNAGLEPIVETRLETAADADKPWRLFADPNLANVIDVSFLDGKESPDVFENVEFSVDAIGYKVRNVFGAGLMDFRGAYMNPGKPLE